MKEVIVNKNDSGNRLDKFIVKSFPAIPESLIYKYIRKKRIKVNNKKAECSLKIKENDIINLYINDEFFEKPSYQENFKQASTNLDIIYEDDNIILVNKKPGLIVHPDKNIQSDCLINRIKNYLFQKGEYNPRKENSFTPSLANRIDRNTSGIVIAAKNAESLRVLNEKIKFRELDKSYICIVCGNPKKKNDVLKSYLIKNNDQNRVYITNNKQNDSCSKTIITEYKVIDSTEKFALLKVNLLTGRTHQIRAHLASINHPILGDGKYGLNSVNRKYGYKYQALCSQKLKFNFKNDASILGYLSGKEFEIPESKIWFVKDFYENLVN